MVKKSENHYLKFGTLIKANLFLTIYELLSTYFFFAGWGEGSWQSNVSDILLSQTAEYVIQLIAANLIILSLVFLFNKNKTQEKIFIALSTVPLFLLFYFLYLY